MGNDRRRPPATRGLPALASTGGRRRLAELRPQLDAWSCAVVEKPFDIDGLLAAVYSCLGKGTDGFEAVAG